MTYNVFKRKDLRLFTISFVFILVWWNIITDTSSISRVASETLLKDNTSDQETGNNNIINLEEEKKKVLETDVTTSGTTTTEAGDTFTKLEVVNETTTQKERGRNSATTTATSIEIAALSTTEMTTTPTTPSIIHCVSWDKNTDDWWQNHPDWEVSLQDENETHTCFVPILNQEKAMFFRQVHENQFHGNCSNVLQRFLVGSGFAATVDRLRPTFWRALHKKQPFQRSKHFRQFRWIYAPTYNETHPEMNSWASCESQDMFCYFLPISSCDYVEKVEHRPDRNLLKYMTALESRQYHWLLSYIMRPRHIVRKKLYELLQEIAPKDILVPSSKSSLSSSSSSSSSSTSTSSTSPFCTAMHVRRTDATTEQNLHKRNFYPISAYIETGRVQNGTNILLLTDDRSSIEEAELLHPQYNWYYINRTRLRGNHGKNHHIPSGDRGLEVLYILAEFRLIQNCNTLIHGTSNMVTFFKHYMKDKMMEEQASSSRSGSRSDGNSVAKYVVRTIQIDSDIKTQPSVSAGAFMKELNKKLKAHKIMNMTEV